MSRLCTPADRTLPLSPLAASALEQTSVTFLSCLRRNGASALEQCNLFSISASSRRRLCSRLDVQPGRVEEALPQRRHRRPPRRPDDEGDGADETLEQLDQRGDARLLRTRRTKA